MMELLLNQVGHILMAQLLLKMAEDSKIYTVIDM